MKSLFRILPALFVVLYNNAQSQCTYTGLASSYCSSDPAVSLTPSVSGGTFSGPGITGSVFTPSVAGPGTHTVTYQTCSGNYSVTAGTYSPLTTAGTAVYLSDDDISTSKSIGFTFKFFCSNYTSFYISSNGFITFSNNFADGCCSGDFLPNYTVPDNLVAFAWSDLDPSSSGSITYTTVGTSPNRKLLVNFIGVDHYGGTDPITVQVQLHETTNIIQIHTATMTTDGNYHTMGIENSGGTVAYVVPGRNSDDTWSASNEMYAFIPANCVSSQTTTVNGPTITVAGTPSTCAGSAVTMTASGANTYTWAANNSTLSTNSATPVTTTTYVVSGKDLNGCVANSAFVVTVTPAPPVTINGPSSACSGSSVTLIVGGSSTYTWNTGSTSAAIVVTVGPGSNNFSVTGTSNSCTNSAFKTVSVIPTPTVTVSASSTVVCKGNSAVLTGSGAATYSWSTSASGNTISVTPTVSTNYIITGTTQGCSASASIAVNVDPGPTLSTSISGTMLCANETLTLTGSGATTYTWLAPTGTKTLSPQVNLTLPSGTYIYTLTAANTNSCVSSVTHSFVVDKCVGIDEQGSETFSAIYPNPSSGWFTVTVKEYAEVSIVSLTGQVVLKSVFTANGAHMVNAEGLCAGVYIVSVKDEAGVRQERLVINR